MLLLDPLAGLAEELERTLVHELDADLGHQPPPARGRGWPSRPRRGSRSGASGCGTSRLLHGARLDLARTWPHHVESQFHMMELHRCGTLAPARCEGQAVEPLTRRSSDDGLRPGERHPGGRPRRRCWSRPSSRPTEPLTFAELADETRPATSTTSRLLTALERTELLERDDGRVATSPARSSGCYATRHDPCERARPAGPPGPRARSARRPARPSTSASPAATGSSRSPRSTPRYLLGTRDWTERRGPAARLGAGQGPLRLRRARRCPPASSSGPDRGTTRPTVAPLRRDLARRPPPRLRHHRRRARGRADRHRRPRARRPRRGGRRPRASPAPPHDWTDRLDRPGRLLIDQAAAAARRCSDRHVTHARRAWHDARGDPAGPLRRDAGRQRPARPRADPRGARHATWSRRRCSSTR